MSSDPRRGSGAVDDILEELKRKGQKPAASGQSVDDILSEMGLGGKPWTPPRPASKPAGAGPRAGGPAGQAGVPGAPGPAPPPAEKPSASASRDASPAAGAASAAGKAAKPGAGAGAAAGTRAGSPAAAGAPPAQAKTGQPAAKTSQPAAKTPQPEAGPGAAKAPQAAAGAPPKPRRPRGETGPEAKPASAPAGGGGRGKPAPQTAPPPPKGGGTTIWDVEALRNEMDGGDAGPRIGKAAALDKVDPDKFKGDTELLSWFSGEGAEEEDSPADRRARKKAEKERRKQEAADRKGQKGRRDEGEYVALPDPGQLAAGEDGDEGWLPPPPTRPVADDDEIVAASAFDLPAEGDGWEPDKSLFDTSSGTGTFSAIRDIVRARTQAAEGGGTGTFRAVKTDTAPQRPAGPGTQAAAARAAGEMKNASTAPLASLAGPEVDMTQPVPLAGWASKKPAPKAAQAPPPPSPRPAAPEKPAATQSSAAPKGPAAPPRQEEGHDTRDFTLGGHGEEEERVPTAAFTQEFENDAPPPQADRARSLSGTRSLNSTRSLYLDDMVDDRFREFFGETVAAGRDTAEHGTRGTRKRKKSRSAVITGEFVKLAEMVEQAEYDENAFEEDFEDYDRPQDAALIEQDIKLLRATLTRRSIITAALALLLLWLGLGWAGVLGLPAFIAPAGNFALFAGVYLALFIVAVAVNFTTVATGLIGLFGEPTVDSAPALAAVGGLLQGVVLMVQALGTAPADPSLATLFAGAAALVLCFNALGKRARAVSILRNFQLASAGFDHSAGYVLDDSQELAYSITKGLEENSPCLLLSRPTALVRGFLRQSFSQRSSDRTGRILGWVLLGAALLAGLLSFVFTRDLFTVLSAFAGLLCIGAPLSSTLVAAVPSLLLQRSASRVGAVVPGWSAIEELGRVNVVMAGARDIFPPSSVSLKGIKTFEKERIDLAILYAASVLVEGCDTLRDIFLAVIQGKSDMLYKVESLSREAGYGFTAWVDSSRVVIGSREMLQKHGIKPPPIEVEVKYVPDGHLPVYLAVSGKLFAMFIVGYGADPEVADTIDSLVRSGVSLLVQSEDMNVTAELVERAYGLPHGVVKVLGRREQDLLEPLTAFLPESEGVMTHMGSFTSFIGGMAAAAGCAAAERMSSIVQIASVALACLLGLMLVFSGGLAGLSMPLVLLYQASWTLLVSALPFARRF